MPRFMRYLLIALIHGILLNSCDTTTEKAVSSCETNALNASKNYNALIVGFDEQLVLKAVEQPNDSGALGRNKANYFHVRFQITMSKLTDLAVVSQRTDALQAFLKNLEYSFNFQEENGGFKLRAPLSLLNNPDIPTANAGDRVSAVAFFAYSLGLSLITLENSDWYQSAEQTVLIRDQVRGFNSKIALTLTYLKTNQNILKQVDKNAPNRLLFDAIAFYSLGTYIEDRQAQEIGIDFIALALDLVDETSGYFIEGGGWDSSYNGVALQLGFEIYSMLPDEASKEVLGEKLVCATEWQISRILPDGEISTAGNTRVFPGGESFLGREKTVDVKSTVRTLLYYAILTEDSFYKDLANTVLRFYQ